MTHARCLALVLSLMLAAGCGSDSDDGGGGSGGSSGSGGGSGSGGNGGSAGSAGAAGSAASCTSATQCKLFSSSCDGCTCIPLHVSEPDPPCNGTEVSCFADPCLQKVAICDTTTGMCAVGPDT